MTTVDSIKILAYQKEYTKMSNKYVDTPVSVFVAGSGDYSIVAANDTENEATDSYSYAEGSNTHATGNCAHAEGFGTLAKGYDSHAEGNYTEAIGESSHAEGSETHAYGFNSHAEGWDTTSWEQQCHAEGSGTFAGNGNSHAEGGVTIAAGSCSHSEGTNAAAYGSYSHAEGEGSRKDIKLTGSDKTYSFTGASAFSLKKGMVIFDPNTKNVRKITAIDTTNDSITLNYTLGTLTQQKCQCYYHCASETGSHVEGSLNIASGMYAHAEGYGNVASSYHSHAEGGNNTASGERSHAEGAFTVASSLDSHAEGYYTKASGQYQHVSGKYNVEDLNNEYAEIIGIGTAESDRKNGRTLDWHGNETLYNNLEASGIRSRNGITLGYGTTASVTLTASDLKKIINKSKEKLIFSSLVTIDETTHQFATTSRIINLLPYVSKTFTIVWDGTTYSNLTVSLTPQTGLMQLGSISTTGCSIKQYVDPGNRIVISTDNLSGTHFLQIFANE